MHWKERVGGTGSSWQWRLKKLKKLSHGNFYHLCHGEPPVQWGCWAQAGICASFRGVGLLRQFLLSWSQPHDVQFCDILSRTEMPCSCQKPDSSPVRFVLLLIVLCQQTDSIHHVALHSGWVYWNDLWEYRGFSSFCMRVPKLYVVPWHVAGTRWPCLHPYLLE